MKILQSKRFQIGWAMWTLFLGVSLAFFSLFQNISTFDEYINAFITFDLPNSWCPTFLTLYGLTSLGSLALKNKFLSGISRFAGLVLLPIGFLATYEFTFESSGDPLPVYIYAQTIHVTEVLTGIFTIYLLKKNSKT